MIPANPIRVGLLLLMLIAACRDNPAAPSRLPSWVDSLIRQLEAQPVANPPAFVARYAYKGQTVYYVPPRCCDIESDLFRGDGTLLCHPDGGITGRGDGRCPDFLSERKDEQVIWRDARRPPG